MATPDKPEPVVKQEKHKAKSAILITAILLLTALWNGLVIKWYNTKDQKYSKWWHIVGFIIRGLIVLLTLLTLGVNWMLIAGFCCWPVYDIIINLANGWKWYYGGNTSEIDKLNNTLVWAAKGLYTLGTILFILLHHIL